MSRTIAFGAQTLVVKYFTTGLQSWDGSTPVTVQFSAHVEGTDGVHAIKVSSFMSSFTAGSTTTQIGNDQGPFVLTPPFSYGGAFTVPVTRSAVGTVTNEFLILVETAPKSGEFFRDTVIDSLKLNFGIK